MVVDTAANASVGVVEDERGIFNLFGNLRYSPLAGIGDEGFVWNPYGSTVTNFRKGNLAVFIFVSTTGPDDEKRLGKEFAKYTDDALNAYSGKLY